MLLHSSIKYDMQHDHILKKMNFDLLIPPQGSGRGWGGGGVLDGLRTKYLLPCCCILHSI